MQAIEPCFCCLECTQFFLVYLRLDPDLWTWEMYLLLHIKYIEVLCNGLGLFSYFIFVHTWAQFFIALCQWINWTELSCFVFRCWFSHVSMPLVLVLLMLWGGRLWFVRGCRAQVLRSGHQDLYAAVKRPLQLTQTATVQEVHIIQTYQIFPVNCSHIVLVYRLWDGLLCSSGCDVVKWHGSVPWWFDRLIVIDMLSLWLKSRQSSRMCFNFTFLLISYIFTVLNQSR